MQSEPIAQPATPRDCHDKDVRTTEESTMMQMRSKKKSVRPLRKDKGSDGGPPKEFSHEETEPRETLTRKKKKKKMGKKDQSISKEFSGDDEEFGKPKLSKKKKKSNKSKEPTSKDQSVDEAEAKNTQPRRSTTQKKRKSTKPKENMSKEQSVDEMSAIGPMPHPSREKVSFPGKTLYSRTRRQKNKRNYGEYDERVPAASVRERTVRRQPQLPQLQPSSELPLQKTQSINSLSDANEQNKVKARTTFPTPPGSTIQKPVYDPDKDTFDYLEFLDRHYQNVSPGVKPMSYTQAECEHMCNAALHCFGKESMLVEFDAPVIIVGDIHGHFNDLINMFLIMGRPPAQKFLFLGDYVDRGGMSLESVMLLFAYKIKYPDHVVLLRGNHECARVNKKYGFKRTCDKLDGIDGDFIWAMFQRTFNYMPVAAVVSGKILAMHGGVSPELISLDVLRQIQKPVRNPFRGLCNDMMWGDPDTQYGHWRQSSRGSGFIFGEQVIDDMCQRLGVDLIVRAHQVCLDGFWSFANNRVLTIFSAPSYTNQYHNAACVLKVSSKLVCQLVAFAPNCFEARQRIERTGRLWDDGCDVFDEKPHAPEPIVR